MRRCCQGTRGSGDDAHSLLLMLDTLSCVLQGRADVAAVRYQVCRLMRMLVEITQTLDKVPSEVGIWQSDVTLLLRHACDRTPAADHNTIHSLRLQPSL